MDEASWVGLIIQVGAVLIGAGIIIAQVRTMMEQLGDIAHDVKGLTRRIAYHGERLAALEVRAFGRVRRSQTDMDMDENNS